MIQQQVIDFPPLYEEICGVFPQVLRSRSMLFSFGPQIFNPYNVAIPPQIIEHEAVHGRRQGSNSANVLNWWMRYLADPRFRLEEEVAAHQAEYQWFLRYGNRPQRRRALRLVAERLASPLYGRIIGKSEARDMLKRGQEAIA